MTYISLGGNCAVAYQLNSKGYYTRFPFDWSNISIFQLNSVLEKDFDNFEELEIKKLSENHLFLEDNKLTNSSSLILKNNYNITFAHEILEKYEIETFQEKLKNRIIKFKSILKPTFIRLETRNISDEYFEKQYLKLVKNLGKYFNDFNIIIISKNKEFSTDKISQLCTFIKFNEFSKDWKYNNVDWNFIH